MKLKTILSISAAVILSICNQSLATEILCLGKGAKTGLYRLDIDSGKKSLIIEMESFRNVRTATGAGDRFVTATDDNVTVYETDGYKIVREIPLGNEWVPVSLCSSHDGLGIYMILRDNDGTCHFAALDTDKNDIEISFPLADSITPVALSALSSDEPVVFTENGDVYLIDTVTKEIFAIGNIGDISLTSAFYDSDSKLVYSVAPSSYYPSAIYTVNVDDVGNGITKRLDPVPGIEVLGILDVLPDKDSTPMPPTDLKASFVKESTVGELSFTLPEKDLSGTVLNRMLDYTVSINNTVCKSGKATSGEDVVTDLTVPSPGLYTISVKCENSSPVRHTRYIGPGQLDSISNLHLSHDYTTLSLSWNPVEHAWFDGYIDPDKLTYRVTDLTDNTIVADQLKVTGFSTPLHNSSEDIVTHQYAVSASCNGVQSKTTLSNKAVSGALNVPCRLKFSDGYEYFHTLYDENGDGTKWLMDGSLIGYFSRGDEVCDDWFISGGISLVAGQKYHVYLGAWKNNYGTDSGKDNNPGFKVMLGKQMNPSAMNMELLPYSPTTQAMHQPYHIDLQVEESGIYHLGINSPVPQTIANLMFECIEIVEDNPSRVPESVDFSIERIWLTPGTQYYPSDYIGRSQMIYEYPQSDVDGRPLENLTCVEMSVRNDEWETLLGAPELLNIIPPITGLLAFRKDNPHNDIKLRFHNHYGVGPESTLSITTVSDFSELTGVTDLCGESEPDGTVLRWTPPSDIYHYRISLYVDGRGLTYYDTTDNGEDGVDPGEFKDIYTDPTISHSYQANVDYKGLYNNTIKSDIFISTPYSAINDTKIEICHVTAESGGIRFNGGYGRNASIWSLDGIELFRGEIPAENYLLNIDPGIYIVKVDDSVIKIRVPR